MVPPLFQITNLVTHSTHDPPYEVSTINVGDPYYVDRDYAYASLPVFMQYLNGIKTGEPPTDLLRRKDGGFRSKTQRWTPANDDCPDPVAYDPQWICFDVTEPVRGTFSRNRRTYPYPPALEWSTMQLIVEGARPRQSSEPPLGSRGAWRGVNVPSW